MKNFKLLKGLWTGEVVEADRWLCGYVIEPIPAAALNPGQVWAWKGRQWEAIEEPAPENPDSAEIESARLESLYQAAMNQQSASCDANFYGLLTAIGALARGTGQTVPAKAAACIAWLESLWADYHSRKASGSINYDFSSYGRCPHSFLEVRGE